MRSSTTATAGASSATGRPFGCSRVPASIGRGAIRSSSRPRASFRTTRFRSTAKSSFLDGRGVSDFNALHSNKNNDVAQFYAFDCMAFNGDDLRDIPLLERREKLAKLLKGQAAGIFAATYERGAIRPAAIPGSLQDGVREHCLQAYRAALSGANLRLGEGERTERIAEAVGARARAIISAARRSACACRSRRLAKARAASKHHPRAAASQRAGACRARAR